MQSNSFNFRASPFVLPTPELGDHESSDLEVQSNRENSASRVGLATGSTLPNQSSLTLGSAYSPQDGSVRARALTERNATELPRERLAIQRCEHTLRHRKDKLLFCPFEIPSGLRISRAQVLSYAVWIRQIDAVRPLLAELDERVWKEQRQGPLKILLGTISFTGMRPMYKPLSFPNAPVIEETLSSQRAIHSENDGRYDWQRDPVSGTWSSQQAIDAARDQAIERDHRWYIDPAGKEILRLFIERGVDLSEAGQCGLTVLHYVAAGLTYCNHFQPLKAAVAQKKEATGVDVLQENVAFYEFLKQKGAREDVKDKRGFTAKDYLSNTRNCCGLS